MTNFMAKEMAHKAETSIPEGIWLIEQYILAKKKFNVKVMPGRSLHEATLFVSAVNTAKDHFINEPIIDPTKSA